MKDNGSRRWLEFSYEDLRIIEVLIKEEAFAPACFHAQQSAEKALKAFVLAKSGSVPKIHSLVELLDHSGEKFQVLYESGSNLDRYYSPSRYPDAIPGSLAEGMPNRNDAIKAKQMALQIFNFVKEKLR